MLGYVDWLGLVTSLASALVGAAIGAWAAITTTRKTLTHSSGQFEQQLKEGSEQARRDHTAQAYSRLLGALATFTAHARQVYAQGGKGKGERRPVVLEELCGAAAAAALWAPPEIRSVLESIQHDRLHSHLIDSATMKENWDNAQLDYENQLRSLTRGMDHELNG